MLSALSPVFSWLAAGHSRYWIAAWTCFALVGLLALLPAWPPARMPRWGRFLAHPVLFALAVWLSFCAWRWPTWFAVNQLNPDEAQMIAGAVTLRHYPVYWRDVDGMSHGPLTDYVLLLGPNLDFDGARWTGTLLLTATLLGSWLAARRFFSSAASRLAVLPGLLFWGSSTFYDIIQYTSEQVPVLLLATAHVLGAYAVTTATPLRRHLSLALAGAALGLMPYAKLQGVMLALLVGVVLVAVFVYRGLKAPAGEGWRRFQSLGWLIGGALAPSVGCAVALTCFQSWDVFLQAYLKSNLIYAGAKHYSWAAMINQWADFMSCIPAYTEFFYGVVFAAVLAAIPAFFRPRAFWAPLLLCLLWAGLSFFTVIYPGRYYHHYLNFLVAPSVLLLACTLHHAQATFALRWRPLGHLMLVLVPGVALWPSVRFHREGNDPLVAAYPQNKSHPRSAVAERILQEARPEDRLTVWGWGPAYHVQTQLPQGTREAHTQLMIEDGPLHDYYIQRFVDDFIRAKPRWFVDAVGGDNFAYKDKDRHWAVHERYPDVAAEIKAHYTFVAEMEGSRIYRRKPAP